MTRDRRSCLQRESPDADIRAVLDDDADLPEGFELLSSWVYVGRGYLGLEQATAAVRSAVGARTR